jgi:DNA-binding Lrp family transcriptional regulator
MSLLTQRAYAKRKRVTPQYINKLVQRGVIRKVGAKIDSKQADAAIRNTSVSPERRRPAQNKKAAVRTRRVPKAEALPKATGIGRGTAGRSLTAARAEREHYQAQIAKLDYEKQIGNLLPREQILIAEQRKNANIRAQFRKLARSVAPLLSRVSDPAEVENLLREEIDVVLNQLARDPLALQDPTLDMPPPVAVLDAAAAGVAAQ